MKYLILMTKVFLLIMFMSFSTMLNAVPAYPDVISFEQPNGSKLQIYLYGDEKISWAETLDGYSLMYNKDGFFEYAIINKKGNMIPSGVIAKEISDRTLSDNEFLKSVTKGNHYSKEQISIILQIWNMKKQEGLKYPTTGNRKLVCILIGFQDKTFVKTGEDFQALFNQVNYTYGGATGSVKDFYAESSFEQLDLTVTVAGPYVAANNMAYYGANSGDNHSVNVDELVIEALNFADPTVDFTEFDNDENGTIDAVYIIFAGYGEEAGGGANTIWSHAGYISQQTLDGKTINRYSCSPELRQNYGSNITRIGVICHEFGHVLGAIDYYDVNYDTGGSYTGTGNWDLMASGSWNNGGATPAPHNAYTKCYVYNWANPIVLTGNQNITINNSTQNPDFYRYNTQTDGEFYLLENKQKIGFNYSVPGHGMLIYHVDENWLLSHWGGNNVNVSEHQGFYPMAANSNVSNGISTEGSSTINTSGCPWPGTNNKTEFTDLTTPASITWDGRNAYKPIKNISENTTDKTVSFCFNCEDAQDFSSTPISFEQIDLTWGHNITNNNVMIAYSTSENFGTPINGQVYNADDDIVGGGKVLYSGNLLSYNHIGLEGNTQYYYKAWSIFEGNSYSGGAVTSSTTFCSPIISFPMQEGFESGYIPDCWTSYRGENGLGQLQDWRTSNTSYSGAKAGFIQFENVSGGLAQDWLVSVPITVPTGTGVALKYYEKQYSNSNKGAIFRIKVSETSQTDISSFADLETYDESSFSNSYSQRTVSLSSYAGKTIFIAFVLEVDASGDAWYVDDISVETGVGVSDVNLGNTKIYPNPCDNVVSIIPSKKNVDYSVKLIDVSGKVFYNVNTINKTELNIEGLSKGIYFIELYYDSNVEVHKLFVK